MKIKDIKAREILDSKGQPTIEAEVILENGIKAIAQVPSGASTGKSEAWELRDGDQKRFHGKGVLKAIKNINTVIKNLLVGQDILNQAKIDSLMIAKDGTKNKSRLGGNAMIGVSMACCKAGALAQKIPLYQYFGKLSGNKKYILSEPLILVMEGGKHGNFATDIQEFMVVPQKEKFLTFKARLKAGEEIFTILKKILQNKKYSTEIGMEGGFCPKELESNEEALELIWEAIKKTLYSTKQIGLALDGAASEFYQGKLYVLKSEENKALTSRQWTEKILSWTKKYSIISLEDMYDQEDWQEWSYLTSKVKNKIQIIGDDLLTTNLARIEKAIKLKACNAVLIKPNQAGTITETIGAIKLSHQNNLKTIVSHRAGETMDSLIADLAVGAGCAQCKFGGVGKAERMAKYNRLLEIEEELTKQSTN